MHTILQRISILFLPLIGFLFGFLVGSPSFGLTISDTPKPTKTPLPYQENAIFKLRGEINVNSFEEGIEIIGENYVDPSVLTPKKISESLLKGLVMSLDDPYSEYFTGEEEKEFLDSLNGEFEGIGARLRKSGDSIAIEEVLRDTPAAKSGLLPGDIIIRVDGNATDGKSVADVVKEIRGEGGTIVMLSIFREGKDEILDFSVKRDKIHVESVTYKEEKGIAIFTVSQFAEDTIPLFKKYLQEALLRQPKGIIVDLRYNAGGYLTGAVEMASFFLPKNSPILTVEYPNEQNTEKRRGKEEHFSSGGNALDIPMVILINGGSASASEIFTGALRDNKRALIIGEKSFGKGSVQNIFPIESSTTGEKIKLTIGKWYPPSGVNVHDQQIEPNVFVEMTVEDMKEEKDPQLETAIEYLQKEAVTIVIDAETFSPLQTPSLSPEISPTVNSSEEENKSDSSN
jgi:carboxyl-terminal processing protease